ncbi:MAG TPA: Ig-like domain-containing protein, partial [Gemmataceae bacterium]|nr:Ig-like domain-containing protein [Gemmataceae bacterium]
ARLAVEALEARELLSAAPLPATPLAQESFDRTATGALPSGWAQYSSQGDFAVGAGGNARSAGLSTAGSGSLAARAWVSAAQPADVQANVQIFANNASPAQLVVRGSNLDTAAPTYYALSVTRGLNVQLLRVVNGATTTLGQVRSASYLSNQWVQVSLQASGSNLQVYVQRMDNGQFLNARGQWQFSPVAALERNDYAIRSGGQVGLNRAAGSAGTVTFDNFSVTGVSLDGRTAPRVYAQETFNSTRGGALPAGWEQWSNQGGFAASATQALSPRNRLAATGAAGEDDRAWLKAPAPADAQASTAVYLDNTDPAAVFLRGSNLSTAAPSYYALAVTRGVQAQLLRVVNGVTTVLGTVRSSSYLSGRWVQVTLQASGSTLLGIVQRLDTRQYLTANGTWQSSPVAALSTSDSRLGGAGLAGLARGSAAATLTFDNFSVAALPTRGLRVAVTAPGNGAVLSSPTTVQATVSNYTRVDRVDFLVDGVRVGSDTSGPYSLALDPSTLTVGAHTLQVVAYDHSGTTAQASLNFSTSAGSSVKSPGAIPQHYSYIRLAELAYAGTPLDSFAQQLLRNSVDLVIPNVSYLQAIQAVSPKTPQLIYTNYSNVYQNLLTDWLSWADANHVSREAAFYHVTKPTAFSGSSSGAQPVNWFWGVYEGGNQANFTDFTSAAHSWTHSVAFGGYGTSMYVGYTDPFREINVSLATAAAGGWSGVLEYATAVDAYGNPTAWAPLRTLSDTTAGLRRSGQITFDPPSNWKTASINGSAPLFYVRWRTTSDGRAPVANTVTGRNYTNSRDGFTGTIPVFDYAADTNHDGYLNNQEYAVALRHGATARFAYESRLFYPAYGPMRPATNPSNSSFRAWAADYAARQFKGQSPADGFFVDNSGAKAPAADGSVRESLSSYSSDYGSLLGGVERAVPSHLVLANTSGGGTNADAMLSQNVASFEEFAIRPLAQNWQQFEDLAAQVEHRESLHRPPPYQVLDSLPTNGSPTDARTQIATLAYYYLLADPKTTFLDLFGGYSPSSSWTQHWSQAVTYNVGQPQGDWSLFASGSDPSNRALTYHVYQRNYTNSLILYRPLSHTQGNSGTGSLSSSSAVTLHLNGTYRPLNANGRLGSPVTSVTLRNGEGAILVKV